MTKWWIIFWSALVAVLLGFLLWKNRRSYPGRRWRWHTAKSLFDVLIIGTSVLWLPALLVGWCTLWIIRPLPTSSLKATVAVFAAMLLSVAATFCMELLVLCSVFSVDLITGSNGFLGRLAGLRAEAENV